MKIAVFDFGWTYTVETPYNEPLGGTQSAICYWLEEMAIKSHDVYLINNSSQLLIRGVHHISETNYSSVFANNKLIFDLIIVSSSANNLFQIKNIINNPTTLYCLWTGHDIDQHVSKQLDNEKIRDFVDLFIFVSEWQRTRFIEKYSINYKSTIVMANGIGKPFEKYLESPLDKIHNSMGYCSVPWRGLKLLAPIFTSIHNKFPDSTLNIFSGLNIYNQTETDNFDQIFKTITGVNFARGVSQTMLADNLAKIEYLTYPNIFRETSCIAILQAMACGCIVVTSDLGALKESTANLARYIDINLYCFDEDKYISDFILTIQDLMEKTDEEKNILSELSRAHIKKYHLYSSICEKFVNDISIILNNHINYICQIYPVLLTNSMQLFTTNKLIEALHEFKSIKNFSNINDYYVVKLNMGVCYSFIRQLEMAKLHFKLCKEIKNDFNVNKNIALLELAFENIDEFLIYAKEAISFEFNITLAQIIAEKLETQCKFHESKGMYQAILDIEPTNISALNNFGNLCLITLTSSENPTSVINRTFGKSLEHSIKFNDERKTELIASNIILNNLYDWTLSDATIFERSCEWTKYFPKKQDLISIASKLDRTNVNKKIKIGYISNDFITHPVGYMFESILKNHDLNNFEIYCYDGASYLQDNLVKMRLKSCNNAVWRVIDSLSNSALLKLLVDDNLDILVDMMGHTRNTRINVLQYKPARIIVEYFAYPGTTGIKEIDYKFTDIYATPPSTQKYYTEKLYYLPNGFQCYTPPIEIESVKDYNRDKYSIHLCCFNNPIKLSQPTIQTFAQILAKLPESKLFLRYCYYKSSYVTEVIYKQFQDLGIDRDRIDIGHLDLVNALLLYNKMDIVLDPFPYNGGTISSEAIYMNTPIITLAGTTYVSRVGVSLLSNLGLDKYIADSTSSYIQKVIDLARNPTELKNLHQTLRVRMLKSDLADSVKFTSNIEAAYVDMVKKLKK